MGKRWISDSDMDTLLDIANKQYNDTICFASKPNKYLHAFSQIQTKLETTIRNGVEVKRILIALHVGSKDNGTTSYNLISALEENLSMLDYKLGTDIHRYCPFPSSCLFPCGKTDLRMHIIQI